MENAVKKLNEALVTITSQQTALNGDDLLASLKAVKAVVRAVEMLTKITPAVEEPVQQVEPAVEETVQEPIPEQAVEQVEQAVAEAVAEAEQAEEVPAEQEEHKPINPNGLKILSDLAQAAEDKEHIALLGTDPLGWCEYPIEKVIEASQWVSKKNDNTLWYHLSEVGLSNPTGCRLNSRHSFFLEPDGSLTWCDYGKGEHEKTIHFGIVKRLGKPSCLALFDSFDGDKVVTVFQKMFNGKLETFKPGKGKVVKMLDINDFKQAVFGRTVA